MTIGYELFELYNMFFLNVTGHAEQLEGRCILFE